MKSIVCSAILSLVYAQRKGEWEEAAYADNEDLCWDQGGRYDVHFLEGSTFKKDWDSDWTCWMNPWSWCEAAGGYRDA